MIFVPTILWFFTSLFGRFILGLFWCLMKKIHQQHSWKSTNVLFLLALPLTPFNPSPSSPSTNLASSLTLVHSPPSLMMTLIFSPSEHPRILEIKWALLTTTNWNSSVLDKKEAGFTQQRSLFFGNSICIDLWGGGRASKQEIGSGSGFILPWEL